MTQPSGNNPSAEFIREINRIYHEAEAEIYDAFHPEIIVAERKTWQWLAGFFEKSAKGRRILDIGSGTGFVPQMLSEFLGEGDVIVLTDISSKMLTEAKRKLAGRAFPAFEFYETSAERLPFPDASFDTVTLNSVLHHIADTAAFLKELDRVLKPGGLILIAHEPNQAFYANAALQSIVRLIAAAHTVPRRLKRLFGPAPVLSRTAYTPIYARVNAHLRARGFIKEDLSSAQIQQYVDVHSPTASGIPNPQKGFSPRIMPPRYLPAYKVLAGYTMAHLGKHGVGAGRMLSACEKVLRRFFPRSGSAFVMVLQKPAV